MIAGTFAKRFFFWQKDFKNSKNETCVLFIKTKSYYIEHLWTITFLVLQGFHFHLKMAASESGFNSNLIFAIIIVLIAVIYKSDCSKCLLLPDHFSFELSQIVFVCFSFSCSQKHQISLKISSLLCYFCMLLSEKLSHHSYFLHWQRHLFATKCPSLRLHHCGKVFDHSYLYHQHKYHIVIKVPLLR